MKPSLKYGLILGGIALAATSVLIYMRKQYQLINDACYSIAGGVVHSLGLNSVKMTLFFKIVNESDLTIEVSKMKFNIYVNGMFITTINKPDSQTLYSKSSTTVQLDLDFNPTDLLRAGLKNITEVVMDNSKLVISIKGNFSAKTGIIRLNNFLVDETITLKDILNPPANAKKC